MKDDSQNNEKISGHSDQPVSRRDAMKRIGIVGLGIVFGSRIAKTAMAEDKIPGTLLAAGPCYNSNCHTTNIHANYSAYAPGPPPRYYSLNTYTSFTKCYYTSCS